RRQSPRRPRLHRLRRGTRRQRQHSSTPRKNTPPARSRNGISYPASLPPAKRPADFGRELVAAGAPALKSEAVLAMHFAWWELQSVHETVTSGRHFHFRKTLHESFTMSIATPYLQLCLRFIAITAIAWLGIPVLLGHGEEALSKKVEEFLAQPHFKTAHIGFLFVDLETGEV